MKWLIFVLIGLNTVIDFAQDHPHAGIWKDAHTIRLHSTQYLSNIVGQKDYLRHWDDSLQSFVSSIPDNLSYAPAANRDLEVINREINYQDEYQLWKWDEFTPKRFDSILKQNKIIGKVRLTYDEKGRLLQSEIRSKEHKLVRNRWTYTFKYSENELENKLMFNLNSKRFYWFAHYQSSYAGKFMNRPLRLRSNWSIDYTFDKKNRMLAAEELYTSKANQREASATGHIFHNAIWDVKGRLLQRCYFSKNDSVTKITEQIFRERPFDLKEEQKEYTILKTPSIAKWLIQKSKTEKLKIVDYVGERNSGEYIVNSNEEPLLRLWKTESSRKILYQTIKDSNSIYRSQFEIYNFPDLSDTLPYDPDYRKKRMNSEIPQELTYRRPPGLIDARTASANRKSIQKLNGGWILIRYERGSSDGQTSFAVGYNPFVRLDILDTKYVILDPKGRVQYFGGHRKIAKVNW